MAYDMLKLAERIVVYSPQIVENYKLKSGEGLSVPFVVIWLLGDLCNLIGAFPMRPRFPMSLISGFQGR